MSARWRVAGSALAFATVLAVAALSRVPTAHAEPDEAIIRLSWRTLGVRLEECRRLTEEELEALAPHMRTPESCTGRNADYELRVTLAGAGVVTDTVHPTGLRTDRPIYVLRDLPVAPGSHQVSVRFTALVPPDVTARRANVEGSPLEIHYEGELTLAAAEIALITLDATGTALVRRGP